MSYSATTIPGHMVDLLTSGVLATLATVRPDGSPAISNTWVDFDGTHVITSAEGGSRKAANIRHEPRVALSVVDPADRWRYLLIRGSVTEIQGDPDLAFIDRMARRYLGADYESRATDRDVFIIAVDQVRVGEGSGPSR